MKKREGVQHIHAVKTLMVVRSRKKNTYFNFKILNTEFESRPFLNRTISNISIVKGIFDLC